MTHSPKFNSHSYQYQSKQRIPVSADDGKPKTLNFQKNRSEQEKFSLNVNEADEQNESIEINCENYQYKPKFIKQSGQNQSQNTQKSDFNIDFGLINGENKGQTMVSSKKHDNFQSKHNESMQSCEEIAPEQADFEASIYNHSNSFIRNMNDTSQNRKGNFDHKIVTPVGPDNISSVSPIQFSPKSFDESNNTIINQYLNKSGLINTKFSPSHHHSQIQSANKSNKKNLQNSKSGQAGQTSNNGTMNNNLLSMSMQKQLNLISSDHEAPPQKPLFQEEIEDLKIPLKTNDLFQQFENHQNELKSNFLLKEQETARIKTNQSEIKTPKNQMTQQNIVQKPQSQNRNNQKEGRHIAENKFGITSQPQTKIHEDCQKIQGQRPERREICSDIGQFPSSKPNGSQSVLEINKLELDYLQNYRAYSPESLNSQNSKRSQRSTIYESEIQNPEILDQNNLVQRGENFEVQQGRSHSYSNTNSVNSGAQRGAKRLQSITKNFSKSNLQNIIEKSESTIPTVMANESDSKSQSPKTKIQRSTSQIGKRPINGETTYRSRGGTQHQNINSTNNTSNVQLSSIVSPSNIQPFSSTSSAANSITQNNLFKSIKKYPSYKNIISNNYRQSPIKTQITPQNFNSQENIQLTQNITPNASITSSSNNENLAGEITGSQTHLSWLKKQKQEVVMVSQKNLQIDANLVQKVVHPKQDTQSSMNPSPSVSSSLSVGDNNFNEFNQLDRLQLNNHEEISGITGPDLSINSPNQTFNLSNSIINHTSNKKLNPAASFYQNNQNLNLQNSSGGCQVLYDQRNIKKNFNFKGNAYSPLDSGEKVDSSISSKAAEIKRDMCTQTDVASSSEVALPGKPFFGGGIGGFGTIQNNQINVNISFSDNFPESNQAQASRAEDFVFFKSNNPNENNLSSLSDLASYQFNCPISNQSINEQQKHAKYQQSDSITNSTSKDCQPITRTKSTSFFNKSNNDISSHNHSSQLQNYQDFLDKDIIYDNNTFDSSDYERFMCQIQNNLENGSISHCSSQSSFNQQHSTNHQSSQISQKCEGNSENKGSKSPLKLTLITNNYVKRAKPVEVVTSQSNLRTQSPLKNGGGSSSNSNGKLSTARNIQSSQSNCRKQINNQENISFHQPQMIATTSRSNSNLDNNYPNHSNNQTLHLECANQDDRTLHKNMSSFFKEIQSSYKELIPNLSVKGTLSNQKY